MKREWKINGRLLERWFAKTLVNLAYVHGPPPNWGEARDSEGAPRRIAEYCFGLRPFSSKQGLSACASPGHQMRFAREVSFSPVMRGEESEIVGAMYEFSGFRFLLSLVDDDLGPFVRRVAETDEDYAGWLGSELLKPVKRIGMTNGGGRNTQEVRFVWPPPKRRR